MAMDNRSSILGLYSGDSGLNVSPGPGISRLSPYLNFDPSYLQTVQPEFITLEEGVAKGRRFEANFSQIGGAIMIGGTIGGISGLYKGIEETSSAGLTGKVRGTQLLNFITKRSAAFATTVGVIATMYSGFGYLLYSLRGSHEDHFNNLGAGLFTGLLYKAPSGLRTCGIGGLVGLGLSGMFIAISYPEKLKESVFG